MEEYIKNLMELGMPNKAAYFQKYGLEGHVNEAYIPDGFDSIDNFYEYCLETNQNAKDVARDIYE